MFESHRPITHYFDVGEFAGFEISHRNDLNNNMKHHDHAFVTPDQKAAISQARQNKDLRSSALNH